MYLVAPKGTYLYTRDKIWYPKAKDQISRHRPCDPGDPWWPTSILQFPVSHPYFELVDLIELSRSRMIFQGQNRNERWKIQLENVGMSMKNTNEIGGNN